LPCFLRFFFYFFFVHGRDLFIDSWFLQQALGDIVFVELPEEGLHVEAQTKVSSVESVKAVSDIYSPVTGTVVEINTVLSDSPETVSLYNWPLFLCIP